MDLTLKPLLDIGSPLLNYVNDHAQFERKFQGEGTELDALEGDVKGLFHARRSYARCSCFSLGYQRLL